MTPHAHGVIFDIDGTRINSNDAHARAWVQALADFDMFVPFAEVRSLIDMGGDKLLPAAAGIEQDSVAIYDDPAERLAQFDSSPLG